MMILKVIIVSILGGFLCLDRVLVQAMISRPVVAAPVVGLILGDPYTGLIVGAFLELFWIDRLPIGAYILPNDTIAAILIAAASILSGQVLGHLPQGLIAMALLIILPTGLIAQKMDLLITRGNEKLAREALADAGRGDFRAIERGHVFAILKNLLLPAGFILVALPAGIVILTWGYPRLPPGIIRGLTLVYGVLPFIGTAVALNTIHIRGAIPIVCAVFLVTSTIISLIRGL
jgi:PTS system mannose-specific IIC component